MVSIKPPLLKRRPRFPLERRGKDQVQLGATERPLFQATRTRPEKTWIMVGKTGATSQ